MISGLTSGDLFSGLSSSLQAVSESIVRPHRAASQCILNKDVYKRQIEYILFEDGSPKSVSKISDLHLTYAVAVEMCIRDRPARAMRYLDDKHNHAASEDLHSSGCNRHSSG